MPEALTLTLAEVKEPRITVTAPDGQSHQFDPWAIAETIEAKTREVAAANGGNVTLADTFAIVRGAFGLEGLTRAQCMALSKLVREFVEGFDQAKK